MLHFTLVLGCRSFRTFEPALDVLLILRTISQFRDRCQTFYANWSTTVLYKRAFPLLQTCRLLSFLCKRMLLARGEARFGHVEVYISDNSIILRRLAFLIRIERLLVALHKTKAAIGLLLLLLLLTPAVLVIMC